MLAESYTDVHDCFFIPEVVTCIYTYIQIYAQGVYSAPGLSSSCLDSCQISLLPSVLCIHVCTCTCTHLHMLMRGIFWSCFYLHVSSKFDLLFFFLLTYFIPLPPSVNCPFLSLQFHTEESDIRYMHVHTCNYISTLKYPHLFVCIHTYTHIHLYLTLTLIVISATYSLLNALNVH